MFLGGQVDIKSRERGRTRVGQISGVLSCLSYELLATLQGDNSAKRDYKRWTGRKSLDNTFFQTHHDARDELFSTVPGGKTETRRREHRVYWFPLSLYSFPHL